MGLEAISGTKCRFHRLVSSLSDVAPILGLVLPLLLSFVSLKLPLLLLNFSLGRPPAEVYSHSIITRSTEFVRGPQGLPLFVELPMRFKSAPFDLLVDLSHLVLEIDMGSCFSLAKMALPQAQRVIVDRVVQAVEVQLAGGHAHL